MTSSPFDPARGEALRAAHIDAHNQLESGIRLAILNAVAPNPTGALTVEEQQEACQANPLFLEALASVCAELVGWDHADSRRDEFIQLVREWSDDTMHDEGLL